MDCIVGVDLGGTSVRAGIFSQDGRLVRSAQTEIEAWRGADAGLEKISELIERVLLSAPDCKLSGIGVGATGPVDTQKGTINNPYTLPGWENVPVVTWLESHFSLPVVLENDADVAALGEYWQGAGQGVKRLYCVTIGTGIGCALILDGEIYRGLNGTHPEAGHHVIDPNGPLCYCGARGCWESLVSGPAIARQAREKVEKKPETRLLELAHGDLQRIEAPLVFQAARQGDPLAQEVIQMAAQYLALGLVNVVHFFVPEVIVLGGGVMEHADVFLSVIQQVLQQHSVMVPADRVRILPAQLGNQAGMFGAAYAMMQRTINN